MNTATNTQTPGASRGFVFAASGAGYMPLALASAQSLREMCPKAQIDLFTDTPPEGAHPFDQIHIIDRQWFRPKFEALRRSRFDLTVYLDNDLVFLADVSDVFELLERVDVMGAHNELRASRLSNNTWQRPVPASFPQINGGFLGVRRSEQVLRFLSDLETGMVEDRLSKDQAAMRELLFYSNLSVGVLPIEYNLMRFRILDRFGNGYAAPRVLHLRDLQAHLRSGATPITDYRRVLGPLRLARLQALLDGDATLVGKTRRTVSTSPLRHVFKIRPARA